MTIMIVGIILETTIANRGISFKHFINSKLSTIGRKFALDKLVLKNTSSQFSHKQLVLVNDPCFHRGLF
jgi:hypothetical protein